MSRGRRRLRVIDLPDAPREAGLAVGDILLQTRGVTFPCRVVDSALAGAVPVSPLVRLRPIEGAPVGGRFIAAVLSLPTSQARLRAAAPGTHMPQLTIAALRTFEVPLFDAAQQAALVGLMDLIESEHHLQERLTNRRRAMADAIARGVGARIEGTIA